MTYRRVKPKSLLAGQLALLGEVVVRGGNYLISPPGDVVTMTQAEQTAPMWVWGVVCIGLGAAGILSELWLNRLDDPDTSRLARVPDTVHTVLMFLFLLLMLSATVGVLQRQPIYGISAPYDLLVFAIGHWVFANRVHVRKPAAVAK